MRPKYRFVAMAAAVLLCSKAVATIETADDCQSHFLIAVGQSTYQFSPRLAGELGSVRLFGLHSFQRAAAERRFGRVFWRVDLAGPDGSDVVALTVRGSGRLEAKGVVLGELLWDGRDAAAALVPPGRYRATFRSRFVADRDGTAERALRSYDDLSGLAHVDEADAATRYVIVDYTLDAPRARSLRESRLTGSCPVQQNAPLEVGFPYNFYYGSTHSHSNFSDGGQPTSGCSSGNGYGSGTFGPAQVYGYARSTAGLDFWVVNEHNHLINDSVATNNAPVTEAKVKQRYQDGRAAAAAATVDGAFVALYGMEWGVTTNNDQGHVTLLETPLLFGWESCSTCNGPAAECAPGTDCYFDVFTPKRFGYLKMYQRSVENPSPAGALGILCHPGSGEFDNYAFDANADAALQGIAVRSGLAFSTATDCGDANVGSTDYSIRWKAALDKGFHLAPTADHDSHCNTYGQAIPTRTVYLAPNASSPALTKAALLSAHKARHFYATEDPNLQLVFATLDGAHVMGDIFTAASAPTLRAAAYDPDVEAVSTLELWRGQAGTGVPVAPIVSVSGPSTLSFADPVTSGTYYYYVYGVQADGHEFWSAPIWITYDLSGCVAPPTPTAGNDGPLCPGGTLHLTASTVPGATYSWTGPGGFASTEQNPTLANVQPSQAGLYSVVAIVSACPSAPASTTVTVRPAATVLTAAASLCPGETSVASVPDAGAGATYAWTVSNGTEVAGNGSRFLTFGAAPSGSVGLAVTVQFAEGCAASGNALVSIGGSCAPVGTAFHTLPPCRVFDTRDPVGPLGGPSLGPVAKRAWDVSGVCGIPPGALAISANLTVTGPAGGGYLRAFPSNTVAPATSSINFLPGDTRANNAIVRLATDGSSSLTIENGSLGTADAILDVNGYFLVAPPTPTANQLAIRINEVDADQTGTDANEFVELVAPAGTSLSNILLVLHNGSSTFASAGYRTHNLDGQAFPATPLSGGTKSLFVLGPAALAGFVSQPWNALYSAGWPATNAVQNAGANEGDGLLVAFDVNDDGVYEDGVDLVIDKFAYVQSGGTNGGTATNAGFKAIYGSTGSTYLTIDSTTNAMGKNSNTIPPATGGTWNYTTNNVNSLAPTPGALNAGQTNGI